MANQNNRFFEDVSELEKANIKQVIQFCSKEIGLYKECYCILDDLIAYLCKKSDESKKYVFGDSDYCHVFSKHKDFTNIQRLS
jgi:hypothetical protein